MRNIVVIGCCDSGGVGLEIAEALVRRQSQDMIFVVPPNNSVVQVNISEYEKKFKQWQFYNGCFIIKDKWHPYISKFAIATFRELHDANKLIEEKQSPFSRKDRDRIQSIYLKITTK